MSNYNEQWSGNGQAGMEEIFRDLAEITPQIPFDKLVYQTRLMSKRLKKYLAYLREERKSVSTTMRDEMQDAVS